MNYALIRSDARDRLKGNWGTAVLTVLVYSLLSTAIEGIGFVMNEAVSLIGSILFVLVVGPLQYGQATVFLKINRRKKTEMSELFYGFNDNVGNKMMAGVWISIYTFLWSLLFIIPGIVAYYSYSMTYYLMIDNPKLEGKEAITKSKEMMKGHKMELFCLDLTFIGWMILSIFTFGIGMLWVSAYMNTAHARFYEAISGNTGVEKEMEIKQTSEVGGQTETGDATVVYNLKCDQCGATETHTEKTTACPYCDGTMKEEK